MATGPVRDPDDTGDERFEAQTAGDGRSPKAELHHILVQASKGSDIATAGESAESMKRRLEGRRHGDGGEILAKDCSR